MVKKKPRPPFSAAGYDEIFQGLAGYLRHAADSHVKPQDQLKTLREDIVAVAAHDRQAGLLTLNHRHYRSHREDPEPEPARR